MMKLHNPRGIKLPALKIDKGTHRMAIESDTAVKSLIQSKLLLDKNLNQLLTHLLGSTKKIKRLSEQLEARVQRYNVNRASLQALKLKSKHNAERQESIRQLEAIFRNEEKTENEKLDKKIEEKSGEIQATLDTFEKKYKIKLNILNSAHLFFCVDCSQFINSERFHSTTCLCGKRLRNPTDCKSTVAFKLSDNTINFIEDNMWLEYGIDYLLRRKGHTTMCGFLVLGHSGLTHEIDNLAEIKKDNLRIFCECKNTDVKVNDVFVFAGKMMDVGCTRGYIFTTSFETKKEVKYLARSKNISIIDQVLERDDAEILKDIQEGVGVLDDGGD